MRFPSPSQLTSLASSCNAHSWHLCWTGCPNYQQSQPAHPARCVQALNDLFEKLLQRDVPARYLLRLGQGEQELATRLDFSRVGRVNAMLARRLQLLAEVSHIWAGLCQEHASLQQVELATWLDFSRVGRVNAMLARRLQLLAEVHHTWAGLCQEHA